MPPRTAPRTRDPDRTRERLLQAAFAEIYRHGYQAASLDRILTGAQVTKGALYHHFPSKLELGFAVVDEVISGMIDEQVLRPLARPKGDAIATIRTVLREQGRSITDEGVALGCPVGNLVQEMSGLSEEFRARLAPLVASWRDGFARILALGQARGEIRKDVDPERLATFILAAFEGAMTLAKQAKQVAVLRDNMDMLCDLLESVRTERPTPRRRR